jgi:hypothetical protein
MMELLRRKRRPITFRDWQQQQTANLHMHIPELTLLPRLNNLISTASLTRATSGEILSAVNSTQCIDKEFFAQEVKMSTKSADKF